MWNFILQSGIATATVNLTDELSWIGVGLVSVVWVAAGAIVFMALKNNEVTSPLRVEEPAPVAYREAA